MLVHPLCCNDDRAGEIGPTFHFMTRHDLVLANDRPASFSFSSNSVPPAGGAGDGLWSSPTMPLITTPAFTGRGGKSTPTVLPWTSFPLTVPNSIRSSECGSSRAVVACTIATSKISKTSSVRLNLSSQPGSLATMSSGDYAHLLKTLCLAAAVRDVTLRPIVHRNPAVAGWRQASPTILVRIVPQRPNSDVVST